MNTSLLLKDGPMNNLFATWHRPGSDVADHLAQAYSQLVDVPEMASVLALVDAALLELSVANPPAVRAPSPELPRDGFVLHPAPQ
ncbi:MAG: hypothetical protein ACRDZ3_05675 [Acidimicrobiia bacterium]